MCVSAGKSVGEIAWRRWEGIGSRGHVVGWQERRSLDTSASVRGQKEKMGVWAVDVVGWRSCVWGVENWLPIVLVLSVKKVAKSSAVIEVVGGGGGGQRRELNVLKKCSAVDWRGLALLALLGPDWGVGGLWVSGPRARSALVWSAAGGACGLAATAPWGAYTVAVGGPAFGLSSALSGWRPRLSLRWFSWGSRALGGLRMFGARVFSVPASCLAGWGCCSPHTLLNVYMEEPYEHKRAHTHRCTLKHSHWCKNRCSQTPIVLICCCFKTYFVILVMCAAQ